MPANEGRLRATEQMQVQQRWRQGIGMIYTIEVLLVLQGWGYPDLKGSDWQACCSGRRHASSKLEARSFATVIFRQIAQLPMTS